MFSCIMYIYIYIRTWMYLWVLQERDLLVALHHQLSRQNEVFIWSYTCTQDTLQPTATNCNKLQNNAKHRKPQKCADNFLWHSTSSTPRTKKKYPKIGCQNLLLIIKNSCDKRIFPIPHSCRMRQKIGCQNWRWRPRLP